MQTKSLADIDRRDWQIVARKALVKKVLKMVETAEAPVEHIHVSRAFGSVYIRIGIEWDDEYECFDDARTIRIADHRRTSGDHGQPDINIYDAWSFENSLEDLQAIFAEATGA